MTGRITRLAVGTDTGSIQSEGGINVSFDPSGVLAYDLDKLAVGQFVTFDLDSSTSPSAVNILCVKTPRASGSGERRLTPECLRYIGFEQSGSTRIFRFERIVPGEEKTVFRVAAELGLFTKHDIGLQEGPALCIHLLATESQTGGAAEPSHEQLSLGDHDMLAHRARQPVPRKRTPPPVPARSTHSV